MGAPVAISIEKTEQHAYFITILERVVEILLPHCSFVTKECEKEALDNVHLMTNRFAALATLDDVDEADGDLGGNLTSSAGAEVNRTGTVSSAAPLGRWFELKRDIYDLMFTVDDLFRELEEMRESEKQMSSAHSASTASASEGAADHASNARVILKVDVFVTLAQKIADAQLEVPVLVLNVNGDGDQMAQHYFIMVLERVVEILAPFCAIVAKERDEKGSIDSVQSLTNWFAAGRRHYPAKGRAVPSVLKSVLIHTLYELEHGFLDLLLTAEDLLHELDEIRDHVSALAPKQDLFADVFTEEMLNFVVDQKVTLTLVAAIRLVLDMHEIPGPDVIDGRLSTGIDPIPATLQCMLLQLAMDTIVSPDAQHHLLMYSAQL
ncbi:hypothetical protein GGF32_006112 [Allomyces javanicus]|nr:hypothetical protein GGF32_006112 [Allomyces javanicus]